MNLAAIVQDQSSQAEAVLFYVLAPITVLSAVGMLLVKKAVHSALLLAAVMISLAIFYILNEAPFLGIVQIIVYTGAVMMLFLFILMLVGVDSADSLVETIKGQRILGIIAAVGVGGLLIALVSKGNLGHRFFGLEMANGEGNVQGIAKLIFGQYVWPFEVISALLITAALGAMVLAHREPDSDKKINVHYLKSAYVKAHNQWLACPVRELLLVTTQLISQHSYLMERLLIYQFQM